MGLFGNKKKQLIGLDIGSSSVKICELQITGKGGSQRYRLQKLGMAVLPFDAIVEGDIMDSNAVATAIRQVLAEQKIKARDVAISVAGQQVMVKKVTFPLMSPAELAESVRWEAESFFPAGQGLDAYALDFAVLEERPADGNMDVVLVACRKDKIEAYLSCVAMAGAKPVLVDVDVFAIQNLYEIGADEGARDEVVALVNIGAQFTNLTMLVGRKSLFWRDIAWGGHRFTDKLMEDWGISREAAEQLKEGIARRRPHARGGGALPFRHLRQFRRRAGPDHRFLPVQLQGGPPGPGPACRAAAPRWSTSPISSANGCGFPWTGWIRSVPSNG